MDYPGLPEAINHGLYLVPRMTRDELRDVLERAYVESGRGDDALAILDRDAGQAPPVAGAGCPNRPRRMK